MKDAKGHGSNSRGGLSTAEQSMAAHGQAVLAAVRNMGLPRGMAPGYTGRDKMGRSYTAALRDHDRFPKQNPTLPNAEDYKTK